VPADPSLLQLAQLAPASSRYGRLVKGTPPAEQPGGVPVTHLG
jgi:hypothetical protein